MAFVRPKGQGDETHSVLIVYVSGCCSALLWAAATLWIPLGDGLPWGSEASAAGRAECL